MDWIVRERLEHQTVPVAVHRAGAAAADPLHRLVHRLKIAHLLVDLVVFLDELLLDEHDILFFEQCLDLRKTHVEISHISDDIEPGRLANIVIAVIRFLIPAAGLQKPHPVIESECGDRNAVRLRHFTD